jgi:hypothetical protein
MNGNEMDPNQGQPDSGTDAAGAQSEEQLTRRPNGRRSPVLGATPGAEHFGRRRDVGAARSAAVNPEREQSPSLDLDWPELNLPTEHDDGRPVPSTSGTGRGGDSADVRSPLRADASIHPPAKTPSKQPDDARITIADPQEREQPGKRDASGPLFWRQRIGRPTWKSTSTALVAIAVAVWAVPGLVGSSDEVSRSPVPPDRSVAVPRKPAQKAKTAVIGGAAVPLAGPLVTLNPGIAQPGGQVALNGYGFDAGSTVDIVLSQGGQKSGTTVGEFRIDREGNLSAQLTMPDSLGSGTVTITAQQRNSTKLAVAEAATSSEVGHASVAPESGKPGDTIQVSARGFSPREKLNVHWGSLSGKPAAVLEADSAGSLSQASVPVGFQPSGSATVMLVGAKSGTTATAAFYMQALYPGAATQPYSLKAGETLTLTGSGFAPKERVQVFLNASSGEPLMVASADSQGNFDGPALKVPFGLKGEQRVVMLGELSRASVTSGFAVLPYTPSVQPSTYGGAPGTSFSFFAKGFAPGEVVLVRLHRTPGGPGELVSAFRVDDEGEAGAAGSYQISAGDSGTLRFSLVGRRSNGKASASVRVSAAEGSVDLPPREPYTLPPSLQKR